MDALDAIVNSTFEKPPSLSALRSIIEEFRYLAEQQFVAKGGILGGDAEPGSPDEGDKAKAPSTSRSRSAAPQPAEGSAASIAQFARALRNEDPANPAPYLMLRGLRWGELRRSGEYVDPVLLEAPRTDERTHLKRLLLDGQWEELIDQGEQLMASPSGRGWLDLQRYIVTALRALGSQQSGVASAICGELRLLLADIPKLSSMTLMDDTPTANEETLEWIRSEGLQGLSGSATPVADVSPPDDGRVLVEAAKQARPRTTGDVFAVAMEAVAANNPKRALELMMNQLEKERSPRGRFIRETQIAHLMVNSGRDAIAHPILETLIEVIETRRLDQWEIGALVAYPMVLLCRVIDRMSEPPDKLTERRDSLYLQICRLDPMQAVELNDSAPVRSTPQAEN